MIHRSTKTFVFVLSFFQLSLFAYGSHLYYYHGNELETIYCIARDSLKKSTEGNAWYPHWKCTNYFHFCTPWQDWWFYDNYYSNYSDYIETYTRYIERYEKLFAWCERAFDEEISGAEENLVESNRRLEIEKKYNGSDLEYYEETVARLTEQINTAKQKRPGSQKALHDGLANVTRELLNLYNNCIRLHNSPWAIYERGRIFFDQGKTENCMEDIAQLLSLNTDRHPEMLILLGEAYNDANLYNEAIQALSEAIKNDPTNKRAYFQRAIAYFESGEQKLALSDYLASELKPNIVQVDSHFLKISQGIAMGCLQGGVDSTIEFVPSLLSTIYGLGRGAWAFTTNPIGVSEELIESAVNCFNYIRDNISVELLKTLVPELQECIQKWDQFEDEKKGHYVGYIIGRYGVDIFAWGGCARGLKLYRNLKEANIALTLESAAFSGKNAEEMSFAARAFITERKAYQKKCWMETAKQEKHVPGKNNFKPNTSEMIISVEELESLTKPLIGEGMPYRFTFGEAGYQEIVDYGKVIGVYITEAGERIPTTIGKIHYSSKGGYHVVPSSPILKKYIN